MKKAFRNIFIVTAVLLVISCSTLAVTAPAGMFLSTGDYVEDVTTLGVLQAHSLVIAPLFLWDMSAVQRGLYERLIDKAQNINADGITNISFSMKPSPWTILSSFVATVCFDYYIEGVAIRTD
ncbi:MAG: hypothetical protein ACLFR1_04535 [Spirochaetia bacterium]